MADSPSIPPRVVRAGVIVGMLLAAIFGTIAGRGCTWRTKRATPQAAMPAAAPEKTAAPAPGTATPPAELGPLVATEPGAYRLRALTFAIDASGIRLEQSVTASGRVKAPPQSVAADRIEFEVYSATGEKLYAGSVDHPLHRVLEYEDPTQPGTLRRKAHEVAGDVFQLRLPEPLAAARVDFFEVRQNSGGVLRTPLGTVSLR